MRRRTEANRWLGRRRVLLKVGRAVRRRDAGAVLAGLARGQERAVGVHLGDRRLLVLLDPVLVGELLQGHASVSIKGPAVQRTRPLLGEGLLTSEGEAHRRVRRLVAPAFSARRLEGYAEVFGRLAGDLSDSWTDGGRVDLHVAMGELTLDIVGRTLLGVDLTLESAGIRSALESALAEFARGAEGMSLLSGVPASGEALVPSEAVAAVHAALDRILDSRRTSTTSDRGDVVSALLAAQADGLTDQEVHDNAMTLVMAGHETTANALTWTFSLLSAHPKVERTLHAELAGLQGRAPRWDELPGLTYTRAVVAESMRLFPPAWVLGRTVTAEIDLGGWQIRPGTVVAVSPLLLHHDPRWFPDPELFDPARHLDARRLAVPKNAYLPFGSGPRSCIGEQFAWAEATTVLATLAGRWQLRTEPGHVVVPQYAVTLRPGNGLPVRLIRRHAV